MPECFHIREQNLTTTDVLHFKKNLEYSEIRIALCGLDIWPVVLLMIITQLVGVTEGGLLYKCSFWNSRDVKGNCHYSKMLYTCHETRLNTQHCLGIVWAIPSQNPRHKIRSFSLSKEKNYILRSSLYSTNMRQSLEIEDWGKYAGWWRYMIGSWFIDLHLIILA